MAVVGWYVGCVGGGRVRVVGAVYRVREWRADVGGRTDGERRCAGAIVMGAEGLGREGLNGVV